MDENEIQKKQFTSEKKKKEIEARIIILRGKLKCSEASHTQQQNIAAAVITLLAREKKIIQRGKFHANENKSKLLSLLLFLQTETEKRKSKLCTRKKSKAGISCVLTRIMRREAGH